MSNNIIRGGNAVALSEVTSSVVTKLNSMITLAEEINSLCQNYSSVDIELKRTFSKESIEWDSLRMAAKRFGINC